MNDILRIACLRIALQRAFLGRAILRVIQKGQQSFMAVWIKLIKRTKLPDIAVVLTDFVVIAHSFSAQSQK